VKEFWKSVSIWQSYRQKILWHLFTGHGVKPQAWPSCCKTGRITSYTSEVLNFGVLQLSRTRGEFHTQDCAVVCSSCQRSSCGAKKTSKIRKFDQILRAFILLSLHLWGPNLACESKPVVCSFSPHCQLDRYISPKNHILEQTLNFGGSCTHFPLQIMVKYGMLKYIFCTRFYMTIFSLIGIHLLVLGANQQNRRRTVNVTNFEIWELFSDPFR